MAVFIMAIIMIRTLSEEKCEYAAEIEYYKGLFKTDFKEKFVAVFIPSFALIFMYFIFGPIEIYYANIDEYVFNISSFTTILIPISISVVIALSLVIASMPKVVSIVMSVIASGISLASYVQYMFFNEDLVDEFGIFAEAKTLGAKYYISIIVFFVILMTVITVGVLLKNKKYILFVPAIVTVIQTVALIGFSDDVHTEYVTPRMSVIADRSRDMGRESCRLLLKAIDGDTKVRKVIVPQKLVIRETSAKRQ